MHQIKTPISAMRMLLQTMEEEYPEEKKLRELKAELFRIEQYVEMVLTYLRMEDMASDLKFEHYPLDDLIRASIRKYSQMFILKKIQLEYQAAQYYPDLYRGIYLAGLRYNLHLKPRALLLEAGAQTNTVEEVRNAMEPFADILNRVLKGSDKED